MTPLFHLALRGDWAAARPTGSYETSTRSVTLAEQGFIHCSLRHQVAGVADAFYADVPVDDLVLLVIDPGRLGATELRYEAPEPGAEDFPHLYGPLPVAAVVEERPVARDAAGHFVPPDDARPA